MAYLSSHIAVNFIRTNVDMNLSQSRSLSGSPTDWPTQASAQVCCFENTFTTSPTTTLFAEFPQQIGKTCEMQTSKKKRALPRRFSNVLESACLVRTAQDTCRWHDGCRKSTLRRGGCTRAESVSGSQDAPFSLPRLFEG